MPETPPAPKTSNYVTPLGVKKQDPKHNMIYIEPLQANKKKEEKFML